MTTVLVPLSRVPRWCVNFAARHGDAGLSVVDGSLRLRGADGAQATLRPPWGRRYAGAAHPAAFAAAAGVPGSWGVLLVRKGGFGVARGTTTEPRATKVGRRHVQGRSKAGGWSQQRFARRRDDQARTAYAAAAGHAHRVLLDGGPPVALVCGGDRAAVDAVLGDRRLAPLRPVRVPPWLPVPDPTAAVLAGAVADAWSAQVEVVEPTGC